MSSPLFLFPSIHKNREISEEILCIHGPLHSEAPSVLDQYVTTQNIEPLKDAIAGGKGAIVLGAHYGPALYVYILNRMHFNVKALLAREFVRQLHNAGALVIKPLRSEKIVFLI